MALKRQRPDGAEDDIDLDEQLMNLLPDELRDSDEIYLDDEVDGPRGRGGILAIMFGIFFGLLVAGVAAWYLLGGAESNRADGASGPPVVTAEGEPYKTRPEEPGGMMVENKDKLVYNRIAEGDRAVKPEEKLLPEAEQPKAPPQAPMTERPSVQAIPKAPALTMGTPGTPLPPSPAISDTTPPPPPPTPLATGREPLALTAPPNPVEPDAPAPVKAAPAPTAAPKPVTPPPAVATKPAAPPPVTPQTGTATAKGDTLIQVAALRTDTAAEEAWRNIQTTNKDLLGSFPHTVVRADLGDKGIYFRLRVGPVGDRAQAKALCETLKSRGQGCIVVR
jgi:cell division protein FtsN